VGRRGEVYTHSPEINCIARFTVDKQSFCYSNVPTIETKELFVLAANRPLVGTSI